jgi:hypothetical protein
VFRVVRKLFFVEEKLLTHSSHGDCCPDCARMLRSLPENVRSSRQALRGRRRPLVVQRNRSEDEDYLNADQRCSVHERCIPAGLCGQRRFGECVNHIFGSSSPGGGDRIRVRIWFWRSTLLHHFRDELGGHNWLGRYHSQLDGLSDGGHRLDNGYGS